MLALNSLRVHSASVNSHEGSAINTFVVSPHFGSPPAAALLREQFVLALEGNLDVIAALERRDREAGSRVRVGEERVAVPIEHSPAPPRVLWHEDTVPGQLLVEIRSTDRSALLTALTVAFDGAGVDVVWAKVTTLGSTVVDVFCISVPTPAIGRSSAAMREELERDLYAVLPATTPTRPAEEAS